MPKTTQEIINQLSLESPVKGTIRFKEAKQRWWSEEELDDIKFFVDCLENAYLIDVNSSYVQANIHNLKLALGMNRPPIAQKVKEKNK